MQWEPVRFRFLLLRNVLLYWSIPSIIGGLFFLLRPGTLVSHIIANSEISLLRQAEYILVFLLGSTGANTLVVGLLRLCAAYFGMCQDVCQYAKTTMAVPGLLVDYVFPTPHLCLSWLVPDTCCLGWHNGALTVQLIYVTSR
jgi:hypothetical protein